MGHQSQWVCGEDDKLMISHGCDTRASKAKNDLLAQYSNYTTIGIRF